MSTNLRIEFLEQPTEFHRFRYETEVTGGKLGGLLYGRHGSKSCVRLRVSGVDPLLHKEVIVIGGTVNPDLYPHPFFMVGDGCSSGAFQLKKDVASLGSKREFDIVLDKVSLVCVSTKGDKLQDAMNNRKQINFNPFDKDMDDAKYNSRNLKSVRIVFQVYVNNMHGETEVTRAVARSDIITDAKQQVKLGIFDIHPSAAPVAGTQDIWVYFDEPLPHNDVSLFSVEIVPGLMEMPPCPCHVKVARKHLLIVTKADLTQHFFGSNERLKCSLVVKETKSDVSDQRELILINSATESDGLQAFMIEPQMKRKRAMHDKADESLSDVIVDDEFLMTLQK